MNATAATSGEMPGYRPRLVPGVPAGGVIAMALVGASLILGLAVGPDGEEEHQLVRFAVDISEPPHPPAPPRAPFAPEAPLPPGHVTVDAEEIRRSVEEAMRGIDAEAIRREAEAAAQEAMAALEANRAEIEAAKAAAVGHQSSRGGSLDTSFEAPGGVRLVGLSADVTLRAGDGDRVRLVVDERAGSLRSIVTDGVLNVIGTAPTRGMDIVLEVPMESTVTLADFAGDVNLGDFAGTLTADMRRGDISGGSLTAATIRIAEAGDVSLEGVSDRLSVVVQGRSDVSVAQVGTLALEAPGRLDVNVGQVTDGMVLSINGRAEIHVGESEGPVRAQLMGSGTVSIGSGRSDDLDVAVMGSTDFVFNGTAVDPRLFMGGSGSIHVPNVEGEARVQNVGSGEIIAGR